MEKHSPSARPAPSDERSTERADYPQSKGENIDRINLGRRRKSGEPSCQFNLRNRKAAEGCVMSGVVELFSAVEAALNDREIAAYEDFTEAVREVLALAREAEALKREIAELRKKMGYWQRGHERIEECLADAVKADPLDAPIPLIGVEAKRWHAYRAEAFRHALEMMGVPDEFRAEQDGSATSSKGQADA